MLEKLLDIQVDEGFVIFARTLFYGVIIVFAPVIIYGFMKRDKNGEDYNLKRSMFLSIFVLTFILVFRPVMEKADVESALIEDVEHNRISKHYSVKKEGSSLKFERKDGEGAEYFKEKVKAEIVKEDDKVYQVEYQGDHFEVKKEKK